MDQENYPELPRSQSCATLAHRERLVDIGRKQSDPTARTPKPKERIQQAVPIQEAQSYRNAVVTTLPPSSIQPDPSRHSAASLKVHFRSMDDVSEDCTADCDHNNLGHSSDCPHQRILLDANSWSGSDVSGQDVDDEEEEEEEEVNLAPDGGWGWVIVAASFAVNLIADGATFSFGVLYVELLEYFKESRSYTAWIGSLFMSIPLLSGPLASSLTDRYGCRRVTIVGSILAALGFVLSSVSNSVEVLFLTFGLISGFGLALCYVAAIVVVAYYFEKRRSLATGLAVCGSGIGTFIFAPMTQYLIAEYGWRGTTLIVAGLFLNISVCGALMRDIEGTAGSSRRINNSHKKSMSRTGSERTVGSQQQRSRNCSESERTSNNHFCPSTPPEPVFYQQTTDPTGDENLDVSIPDELSPEAGTDIRLCNSLISLPTFLRHGSTADKIPHEVLMTITNNPRLYSIVLDNYPALFEGFVAHDDVFQEGDFRAVTPNVALEDTKSPEEASVATIQQRQHTRHHHHHHPQPWNSAYLKGLRVKKRSLTYRGAMLNLPRYRLRASSCPDIYRNSITTIAREKEGACWDYLDELREVFMDMFDFSYLANPQFVMFAISNALLYCCYHVPYIFIADWAIAQGHPDEDSSFLLSVVGILNTVGVIILGYIGDRSWANPTWIYTGAMFLCGLATAAVPLMPESYSWLATCAGLFGLCIAANYALAAVILVDLISLERFVNAYGLLLLFQGVANLIGPPLAGRISDVVGTPTAFYIAGIVIIFSGAILILLPLFQRVRLHMSPANGSLEAGGGATSILTAKEGALGVNGKTISTSML